QHLVPQLRGAVQRVLRTIHEQPGGAISLGLTDAGSGVRMEVRSRRLVRYIDSSLQEDRHHVPLSVFRGCLRMQLGFLQALFTANGAVVTPAQKGATVRLGSNSLPLLEGVQRLLLNLGIPSRIYSN